MLDTCVLWCVVSLEEEEASERRRKLSFSALDDWTLFNSVQSKQEHARQSEDNEDDD